LYISNADITESNDPISEEECDFIKRLWANPKLQQNYLKIASEVQCDDCMPYFFQNVDQISNPGYIPSNNGIFTFT
jgi:hypothetical protein